MGSILRQILNFIRNSKIIIYMDKLKAQLKEQILEALSLDEMKPEEIDDNAPLFGEGLGLDSIDALELIVLMEKQYGIKLSNPTEGKEVFKSINVMAEDIAKKRTR